MELLVCDVFLNGKILVAQELPLIGIVRNCFMRRLWSEFLRKVDVVLRTRGIHRTEGLLDTLLLNAAKSLHLLCVPVLFLDEDLGYRLLLARSNVVTVELKADFFFGFFQGDILVASLI